MSLYSFFLFFFLFAIFIQILDIYLDDFGCRVDGDLATLGAKAEEVLFSFFLDSFFSFSLSSIFFILTFPLLSSLPHESFPRK